jgi:NAD(P)-dependent dehydrogenase (short-subunit alcohol dehydrogenase family)
MSQVPVQRLGLPGDVSAAVNYFVSDAAGFVTGTVLDVNGGVIG